jgi:chromosome segregation ATPase
MLPFVFLALGAEAVYAGAALAVALLLAFQLRLARRQEATAEVVRRLQKAHREGTLDARSRLEEASKALERLEETVAPRLEGLEPHLADVGSRLDEVEGRVEAIAPGIEGAEARWGAAEESLQDARAQLGRAEETARGLAERFGELEEALRDARTRVSRLEEGLDRARAGLEARVDALDARVEGIGAASAEVSRAARRAGTDARASGEVRGPGPRTLLLLAVLLGALVVLFRCGRSGGADWF